MSKQRYVDIDDVVYHLDDIEVDKDGKCDWTDVANALTHIKLCIEPPGAECSEVQSGDDLAARLADYKEKQFGNWSCATLSIRWHELDEIIAALRGVAQTPPVAWAILYQTGGTGIWKIVQDQASADFWGKEGFPVQPLCAVPSAQSGGAAK